MQTASNGVVQIDVRELVALSVGLAAASKTVQERLKLELRDTAGRLLMDRVRGNLTWSHKIPRTLRMQTGMSAFGPLVRVISGNREVPIGRWFETGRTNHSPVWRHPVGIPSKGFRLPKKRSKWHWVDMTRPHRPYLMPALLESRDQIVQLMIDALAKQIEDTLNAAIAGSVGV